jgi:YgiT-type zinc finger domain-containing protein
MNMFTCSICGAREGREEFVEEVFRIDGKYVLVDRIPASVCARCGEETFSRETTERVRVMVHGQAQPTKSIALKVFEFA